MKAALHLIAILLFVSALCIPALSKRQEAGNTFSTKQALALIRATNSTEHTIKFKTSSFGSLEEVIKLDQLDRDFGVVLNDSSSATVKDYRLAIVAAPDGQHYQVSVRPGSGCAPGFFSNESGVIYQGTALGCPAP
jgi:hypothetical protein